MTPDMIKLLTPLIIAAIGLMLYVIQQAREKHQKEVSFERRLEDKWNEAMTKLSVVPPGGTGRGPGPKLLPKPRLPGIDHTIKNALDHLSGETKVNPDRVRAKCQYCGIPRFLDDECAACGSPPEV